ncbi:MAG: adhesion lipoprotein [Verrucomicrobiales bacterium]|nr:adhesion lipoprotein [Verrucomicrobiales bacterium]
MMRGWIWLMLAMLVACGQGPEEGRGSKNGQSGPLTVVAVNYPLQYFAERIGGDFVKVTMPAPAAEDPADWRPAGKAAREFVQQTQKADLILMNGAGYAKWIKYGSWRESQLVDTSRAFRSSLIELEKAHRVVHRHGKDGREHSHGAISYTVWLDPGLAVRQAEAIRDVLKRKRPDRALMFEKNFEVLKTNLETLGADLPEAATPLLASHPVYHYLQRRFGLNLQSVHWEPGIVPPEREWAALKERLREHRASTMLWESEPSRETADRLQALGVVPVVFVPCGDAPAEGDYLGVMRSNFDRLKKVLEAEQ